MAGHGCAEDEEVLSFAFVVQREAAVSGKPGHHSFDDPVVLAELVLGFDVFAGDVDLDAAVADHHQRLEGVAAGGLAAETAMASDSSARSDRTWIFEAGCCGRPGWDRSEQHSAPPAPSTMRTTQHHRSLA